MKIDGRDRCALLLTSMEYTDSEYKYLYKLLSVNLISFSFCHRITGTGTVISISLQPHGSFFSSKQEWKDVLQMKYTYSPYASFSNLHSFVKFLRLFRLVRFML
jgi:hypothetical protein